MDKETSWDPENLLRKYDPNRSVDPRSMEGILLESSKEVEEESSMTENQSGLPTRVDLDKVQESDKHKNGIPEIKVTWTWHF